MTGERRIAYKELGEEVLAVAIEFVIPEAHIWKCFVGARQSDVLVYEQYRVANSGFELPESIARTLFSDDPWKSIEYNEDE